MSENENSPDPSAFGPSVIDLMEGADPLGDTDAALVLRLLAPLCDAVPSHRRAQIWTAQVVTRIADTDARALADWWLYVTCRESGGGEAFTREERQLQPLLNAQCAGYPLTWYRARQQLPEAVQDAHQSLDLDTYGNVKLPAEREAWRDCVLPALEPVVDALEGVRTPPAVTLERDDLERALKAGDVDVNSRRWNKFLERAEEAERRVAAAARLHAAAEPRVEAVTERLPSLAQIHACHVTSVLDEVLSGSVSADEVELRVNMVVSGAQPQSVGTVHDLVSGWLVEHPVKDGPLVAYQRRRETLLSRLQVLWEELDDPESVKVELDLHELDAVEEKLEAAERARRLRDQKASAQSELAAMRAAGADLERVRAVEVLLEKEDLDGVHGHLDAIREDLQRAEELRVQALRDEAEEVADQMRLLGAPGSLIRQASSVADRAELETLQYRLDQLRDQAVQRVGALIEESQARLDASSAALSKEDAETANGLMARMRGQQGDNRLSEIERLAEELRELLERRSLQVWNADDGEAELLEHVLEHVRAEMHASPLDVRRLHVALKAKPFVILAGLTGSGKSSIARLYAEGLGATSANGRFVRIAIRPHWVDESEVLGYLHPTTNRFQPGWLATLIDACRKDPDLPFFCLLDEMNLAPVEHYLAEVLSALEVSSRQEAMLRLYSPGAQPENSADWEPEIPLPRNLFILGTVNIDESTRPLSDRVIDRANVIQLSLATLGDHHATSGARTAPAGWIVRHSALQRIRADEPSDVHHELLVEIAKIFADMTLGLGMRAHMDVERFLANARVVLDDVDALDVAILQRVVPKLRGFKRDLSEGLQRLHDTLDGVGCHRCCAVLSAWLAPTTDDETFLDGLDSEVGILAT